MKPYAIDNTTSLEADMLGEVRAGFPSPADEEPRERLDLIKLLVRHPASTFFFRIGGTSMIEADMDEGDIIIVDRAVAPYNTVRQYASLMENIQSRELRFVMTRFALCLLMN
jgi:DNA polymerase V